MSSSIQRPQDEVLRERYAEITAMDRAIGMLCKHLAESGLCDNNLLFYCGDNGTSPDAAQGFPHRGAKAEIYQGGTLVQDVMEWPARIPKPRATAFRASTSDLLPTLAAITGQELPDRPLDGKATRNFRNLRHTTITDADYLGPGALIEGSHHLTRPQVTDPDLL